MRTAYALLVALAACLPAAARAQGCPEGQVTSADTRGHCCWPAQTLSQGHCCWWGQEWSIEENACKGEPRCPYGFHATADGCVAGAIAEAPPPAAATAAPPPPGGTRRKKPLTSLVVAGGAIFG